MTLGKAIAVFLVLLALVSGGAMYWLQIHAFYREVTPVAITLVPRDADTDAPQPIPASDIRAIDAESSPIRFRACFETRLAPAEAAERFVAATEPEPLNAPGWFDCFDAASIGAALARGEARAYLSEKNITYGVDRIVALMPDGRAFAWHQLNHCGKRAYDGTQVGEDCPEPGGD